MENKNERVNKKYCEGGRHCWKTTINPTAL
uniref:Uncharacterized protein n=1 Tax=Myoviridae sp. ctHIt1 TaxID=2825076 RepID=A0A8S5V0P1_9CAUD|nr:MAG TPA: hypothetical protein [Myoviridae sp. ctHIt1]DAY43232.1 MAG TPA: hypothetical protein [Caudoviricetes sp.]